MSDWACDGEPLATFFDDGTEPYSQALATARGFCDTCPGRAACLKLSMAAEGDDSVDYRAGIFAGLTPQQRHALAKRGVSLRCAECNEAYDPVDLRNGEIRCLCGRRTMTPIPDRGDQWTHRHTKLARMTIGWLAAHIDLGGEVPDALALSRQMKVGVKDLRRVYQALKEDHVIRRDNGKLVLCDSSASEFFWTPPHLRTCA